MAEAQPRRQTYALFGLLTTLYLVQGLPFGFVTQALPVVLREQGVELSKVTLSSAVALPWALKFLWAPWVDRAKPRRWGRRLGVVIPLIWCSAVAMALLAVVGTQALTWFLVIAVLLNLFAATQDIATDGLAVERLSARLRGLGNSIQIIGYRVGMLIGGGLILIIMDTVGASVAIALLAALLLLCSFVAMASARGEGPRPAAEPTNVSSESRKQAAVLKAVRDPAIVAWLFAIGIYKVGDALAQGLLKPFLVDGGLDIGDIGQLVGTGGFLASILGALVGGWLLRYIGYGRAMLIFGLVQAVSIWPYIHLVDQSLSLSSGYLWAACLFEHFAGSLSSVTLFTIMMHRCRASHAGDDYTLQTCAQVFIGGAATMVSGKIAQSLGYHDFFQLATAVSVGGVLLAWIVYRATARRFDPEPERHGHQDPLPS